MVVVVAVSVRLFSSKLRFSCGCGYLAGLLLSALSGSSAIFFYTILSVSSFKLQNSSNWHLKGIDFKYVFETDLKTEI